MGKSSLWEKATFPLALVLKMLLSNQEVLMEVETMGTYRD